MSKEKKEKLKKAYTILAVISLLLALIVVPKFLPEDTLFYTEMDSVSKVTGDILGIVLILGLLAAVIHFDFFHTESKEKKEKPKKADTILTVISLLLLALIVVLEFLPKDTQFYTVMDSVSKVTGNILNIVLILVLWGAIIYFLLFHTMSKERKEKPKKTDIILAVISSLMLVLIAVPEDLPKDMQFDTVMDSVNKVTGNILGIVLILSLLVAVRHFVFIHTEKSILRTNALTVFLERYKKRIMLITTACGMYGIYLLSIHAQSLLDMLMTGDLFAAQNWPTPDLSILYGILEGKDLFGYYTAQLSLTFISISVMSVLSDRSVLIYWVNASEDRLIKPVFSCFAAYTYYSIGATIGAGIATFSNNGPLFLWFFIANVLILILLTISMIDVYFGRDTKKKKLKDQLRRDVWQYRDAEDGEELSAYNSMRAGRYENSMMNLRQNIYQSHAQSDLNFLKEVYELYFTDSVAFRYTPGKSTLQAMVATLDVQTFPTFYSCLDKFVQDLPRLKNREPEIFWDDSSSLPLYDWDMDEQIWILLAQNEYLQKWLTSQDAGSANNWERENFLLTIKRRFVQLFNDMVTDIAKEQQKEGLDWDENRYLLAMDKVGQVTLANGEGQIPPEDFVLVLDKRSDKLINDSMLASSLLQVFQHLLRREAAAEEIAEQMADFPIINALVPYLDKTDKDTTLLRRYFPPISSSK